ncbi:MAG: response regulator, partial [Rhodosalinus sp.]
MSGADAHLLIVDDDERLRGLLRKFLLRNGFLVSTARDADHARRLLAGLDFDLIVLDVMMPGEDGIAFTRSLRTERETPVLLLTARGETEHRIAGLEAGADDYLAKPFEPRELLLRINAILRRAGPPAGAEPLAALTLGPLRYDARRGVLQRGDETIRLTGAESALMRRLARAPNEPVSRAA